MRQRGTYEKPRRETVEMVDGRVYFSDDNWETVYETKPGGKPRIVTGRAADMARFIAISQAHAGPG